MAHTPGPWAHSDAWKRPSTYGPCIGPDDASPVCIMTGYHGLDITEANARLIAAAPDMLDVLQKIEAVMSIVPPRNSTAEYMEHLRLARATIAKATGEQQQGSA